MCVLSRVWLFATPWTVAHQAPLSLGFSRQEYWSGLQFLSPRDLPDPGIKPMSLASLALAGSFFTTEPPGKPVYYTLHRLKIGCSKIQPSSPSLSEGKYSWNKRTVLIKLAYLYVRHLIITYNNSFRKFLSFQFYWLQNSLEGIIDLLKQ